MLWFDLLSFACCALILFVVLGLMVVAFIWVSWWLLVTGDLHVNSVG